MILSGRKGLERARRRGLRKIQRGQTKPLLTAREELKSDVVLGIAVVHWGDQPSQVIRPNATDNASSDHPPASDSGIGKADLISNPKYSRHFANPRLPRGTQKRSLL